MADVQLESMCALLLALNTDACGPFTDDWVPLLFYVCLFLYRFCLVVVAIRARAVLVRAFSAWTPLLGLSVPEPRPVFALPYTYDDLGHLLVKKNKYREAGSHGATGVLRPCFPHIC